MVHMVKRIEAWGGRLFTVSLLLKEKFGYSDVGTKNAPGLETWGSCLSVVYFNFPDPLPGAK